MCAKCGRSVAWGMVTVTPISSREPVSELWCARCVAAMLGCRPRFAHQMAPRGFDQAPAVQVFGPGGRGG